ncbi:MAG: TonB-dependent receptor domain-containing protein [Solirubrobacterales bacterium]
MRTFAFAASLLLVASLASPAGQGSLSGTVRTSEGQPVPSLALALTGPEGARTLLTGLEGRYQATALEAGEYSLAVSTPGFVLSPEPRVVVGTDAVHLDLVLGPAPVREQLVVTATRGEAPLSTLGTSVTAWDRERLEERAPSVFLQVLQETPGVATARAGGVGVQSSAFVRGGESRFARILVDGVPVNQPGGAYDFGSMLPLELERVEVLRGAASSLYGTDALAGVVQIITRRAPAGETFGLRAEGEGGSFDWWRYQAGLSGNRGRFDWNAGGLRLTTDNQEPNNAFEETAGAASLGVRIDDKSRLRFLVRAEDSTVGTPGPTAFGRPDLDASFDRNDLVLGAELRHTRARVAHELRFGYASTDQLSSNPLDSGSYLPTYGDLVAAFPIADLPKPEGFQNKTARTAGAYQAEVQLGTRHLLTAGTEVEHETGEQGYVASNQITPSRTNGGAYAQDRVLIGSRVHLTVGGRVERNGSFGWAAVPRAALAVRLRDGADATTLRASAGMGIKEPSFFESYGVSFFAQGNPDLKPEKSRTFDAGIEQRFLGGRVRGGATFFHHQYRDQITYDVVDFTTFEGTYVNLAETRARGVELTVEARPATWLSFSGDYTWLDGEVVKNGITFDPVYEEGRPLLRRPKNQGTLSVRAGSGRVDGGATWVAVGARADSDFVGLGLDSNEGYSRVDARVRVRVTRLLEAFVVGENVFDAQYQEVLGYPALGRSIRAGLRLRTGGRP